MAARGSMGTHGTVATVGTMATILTIVGQFGQMGLTDRLFGNRSPGNCGHGRFRQIGMATFGRHHVQFGVAAIGATTSNHISERGHGANVGHRCW